jgi:hypothetical protein
LFFDGVPSEGKEPTERLLLSRPAQKIPFTFVSCTGVSSDVEWAKQIEEKPMPGEQKRAEVATGQGNHREGDAWFAPQRRFCGDLSLRGRLLVGTFPCERFLVADGSPSFMAEIDDYETERGEVMHDQVLRLRLIVCDMFGCLRPFVYACMCGANCVVALVMMTAL